MSQDVAPTDGVPARPAASTRTTDLALVSTGAALLAVCSLLAIPVGPAGAPITLQTFAVLLVGAVLGARRGALAVLLYLLVGFAGLPIFAQGVGGLGTFGRVTLGYLLAFPVAAWVTGWVVQRRASRSWALGLGWALAADVLGTLVVYAGGVPVLALRAHLTLGEAFVANAAFVPFDLVKVVTAAVVATAVHRAFPDLLRGRA